MREVLREVVQTDTNLTFLIGGRTLSDLFSRSRAAREGVGSRTMASTTFPTNNTDENDPFVIRRTWSSDDDNTANAGSNRSPNEPVQREILVKWQMPGNLSPPDAKKQLDPICLIELTG
jgi:hypothetical protein